MTSRWLVSVAPFALSLIAYAMFPNVTNGPIDSRYLIVGIGAALSLVSVGIFLVEGRRERAQRSSMSKIIAEADTRLGQVRAEAEAEADARIARVQTEADKRQAQMRTAAAAETEARVTQALAEADAAAAARVAQARAETRATASNDRHNFYRRLHHEVGNPLQAIEMGAANLLEETNPDLRRNAYESIRVQVTQLGDLVDQLRRLPDIEDETKALDLEPIDMRTLLEGVVQDVKRRNSKTANRALGLHVRDVRSPLPPIPGDQGLLFITFSNLIDNAIKYTPNGGRVDIEAYAEADYIIIEISDNGRGIPAGELPNVWDVVYRARNAEGEPGYGMGLALVRAIVEKHHGQWEINSSAGRPGTTVTVRLPMTNSVEQQREVG